MKVAKTKPAAAQSAVQFNVKLTPKADRSGTVKDLSAVAGVEEIVQTFPGEKDPELSRLYLLKLKPSRAKFTVQHLKDHPGVEYVEGAAPRKLIW